MKLFVVHITGYLGDCYVNANSYAELEIALHKKGYKKFLLTEATVMEIEDIPPPIAYEADPVFGPI